MKETEKECAQDETACVWLKHPDKEGSGKSQTLHKSSSATKKKIALKRFVVIFRSCISSGEHGCDTGPLQNVGDGWVCYCNTERCNSSGENEKSSGPELQPHTSTILATTAAALRSCSLSEMSFFPSE